MLPLIDPTDVSTTEPALIGEAVAALIGSGRGPALAGRIQARDLRTAADVLWGDLDRRRGATGAAAMARLEALSGVLAHQRLAGLLAERGQRGLDAIVEVAAKQRLNVRLGFNPATFAWRVDAVLAEIDSREQPRAPAPHYTARQAVKLGAAA